MPNNCSSCDHPAVREINARIKQDRPLTDISRWLAETGTPITRQALARHAKAHLGARIRHGGNRPMGGDFLESVRDAAADGLASGELGVTLKDGIAAQKAIDMRQERQKDRDWQLKLVAALTGHVVVPRVVDPRVDAIEGEFRRLSSGAE